MFKNFEAISISNVCKLKPFFEKNKSMYCEFSIGEKFMWRNVYQTEYQIYHDTLIMYECYDDNCASFYFPLCEHIEEALDYIDKLCLTQGIKLEFCCLSHEEIEYLSKRYVHHSFFSERNWSDYIYDINSFVTFQGKHLAGKRYYLNKFKKAHPDYKFKLASKEDVDELVKFYEIDKKVINFDNQDEINEYNISIDLIKHFDELKQVCGIVYDDKMIYAYAIGEINNDVLIIHIEKALVEIEGAFQIIVSEFAKAHVNVAKYVNREDDNGDEGLRTSKLQYHPLYIADKFFFVVENNLDLIKKVPSINIDEQIVIEEMKRTDMRDYLKIVVDDELNKYWGYDYREDINEQNIDEQSLFKMLENDFNNKCDISFGIKEKGLLIGEIVIYEIKNNNIAEIGIRIIKDKQKKSIAKKAMKKVIDYLLNEIKLKTLNIRCMKPNVASHKLIDDLGFNKINEDDIFFYFQMVK